MDAPIGKPDDGTSRAMVGDTEPTPSPPDTSVHHGSEHFHRNRWHRRSPCPHGLAEFTPRAWCLSGSSADHLGGRIPHRSPGAFDPTGY